MTSKEDTEIKVVAEGDRFGIYDVQSYQSSPASSTGNQFAKQRYAEDNDVHYEELSSKKLGLFGGPEKRFKDINETAAAIIVFEKDEILAEREFIR